MHCFSAYSRSCTISQLAVFKRLIDATDGMAAALDDPDILCTLFARTREDNFYSRLPT